MAYLNEKILNSLKEARKSKGLSQRELSAKSGVPQSHISKIESGGVDLRVSSLIALARVLDFELELVPRKTLPAIKSIVRASKAADVTASMGVARVDIQRLQDAVNNAASLYLVGQHRQEISSIRALSSEVASKNLDAKMLATIQNSTKEIEKAVNAGQGIIVALQSTEEKITTIRNQLANSPNVIEHARPAYRLGESDE